MSPELCRLVALALVGEDLPVPDDDADLTQWLAGHGWTSERVAQLRQERQVAEQPWPFRVPADAVRPVGFARFTAVLAHARSELGVDGLVPAIHTGPKVIGPAEQRLLAERPPHHGNVG